MSQLQAYQKSKTGDYIVPINEALEEDSTDDVYPTGFPDIDNCLTEDDKSGFRPGDLVIISGKSGNGKTLFAQNLTRNFINKAIPVIFFSYEVRINRVYADFMKMGVEPEPIIYTPKKHITGDIDWVKNKILESDQKYLSQIVVIDHLDFLTSKNIKTDDHRRNEINNIVSELKRFAIDNNKVVILLAHVVKTKDNSLQNEDIADSRAINNLADHIMFVGRGKDETGEITGNNGVVKLSKNRLTGDHILMQFEVTNNKVILPYD